MLDQWIAITCCTDVQVPQKPTDVMILLILWIFTAGFP